MRRIIEDIAGSGIYGDCAGIGSRVRGLSRRKLLAIDSRLGTQVSLPCMQLQRLELLFNGAC